MRMRWIWLLAIMGCSSFEQSATEAVATKASMAPVAAPAPASAGAPREDGARSSLAAERMVIREASLRVRTEDPRKAADAAVRIAAEAGGFVLNSELRTVEGQAREVELQIRVPQESLDASLRKLRKLGTVLLENVSGQDVTEELVDVSARLRAQRTLEERLLVVLGQSAQMTDLLEVERELARVRADIEQREGRLRYLQERSRMASIQVVAQSSEQPLAVASESVGSRFSNAFERSLSLAVSMTEFMIAAIGFLAPIVLFGFVTVPSLLWLLRRFGRRRSVAAVM